MYLGEPSLSRLNQFLNGYNSALIDHNIPFERVGVWRPLSRELSDFHTFVARQFKDSPTSEGYATRILRHAGGDERVALELFWVLLDEYRAQEESLNIKILLDEV